MNPFSQPVKVGKWVDPRCREMMMKNGIHFGCEKSFVERVLETAEDGVRKCADKNMTTDGYMLKMLEDVYRIVGDESRHPLMVLSSWRREEECKWLRHHCKGIGTAKEAEGIYDYCDLDLKACVVLLGKEEEECMSLACMVWGHWARKLQRVYRAHKFRKEVWNRCMVRKELELVFFDETNDTLGTSADGAGDGGTEELKSGPACLSDKVRFG